MAASFTSFPPTLGLHYPPTLLSQRFPPPLPPKPGKDNARLQKLLKRNAKKKASAQAAQSAVVYRSSLSPVNEASPDLEHSDHSTPPRTPETPLRGMSQPPPRFTVRPLYHHVSSPYPQRVGWGHPASFFPDSPTTPSYLFPQHVTPFATAPPPLTVPPPALLSKAVETGAPFRLEITTPAIQVTMLAASSVQSQPAAMPGVLRSTSPLPVRYSGPSPVSVPYSGSQAMMRPLTVLTSFAKPKSPRPNFKATETSRSPKPMFEVPQIRMYTANTSFYESSRTPPVYDTAELTSIGITVQRKTPTPEIRPPTAEVKRGLTPTREIRRAVTQSQTGSLGPDSRNKTPTPEINGASTSKTEVTNVTQTPKEETKSLPPTSEVKRAKTPTYEFPTSRTLSGRPKTPSYHVVRVKTPVFEVSRPNPLLFCVSPIPVESERKTPTAVPAISLSTPQSVKTNDAFTPNGDIHSNITPVELSIDVSKPKSVPYVAKKAEQEIPAALPSYPKPETLPSAPLKPQITKTASHEAPKPAAPQTPPSQRPKPPSAQGSPVATRAHGFARPGPPRTTYGAPVSQRPKTPTHGGFRSSYRGLTPAEYVAHGGIQCYAPAFGLSGAKSTQEELQTPKVMSVKTEAAALEPAVTPKVVAAEVSEGGELSRKEGEEEVSSRLPAVLIPTIVVSQASDIPESASSHQASPSIVTTASAQTVLQDTATPKHTTADKPEVKTPVKKITPEVPKPENQAKHSSVTSASKTEDKVLQKQTKEAPAKASAQKALAGAFGLTRTQESKPGAPAIREGSAPDLPAEASTDSISSKGQEHKPSSSPAAKPDSQVADDSSQAAQVLLKVLGKPKGMKSKLSGWSRLKKHMVVEQEEPKFPDGKDEKKEEAGGPVVGEAKPSEGKPDGNSDTSSQENPKGAKMWDAVLFQMFSTKENIMHQIEINKSEEEKNKEGTKDESKEIPAFAHRLPILLFSPKFDAKKLREAASRPLTKISTVFEMGLIGRKNKEDEPKDFNRTARGFIVS